MRSKTLAPPIHVPALALAVFVVLTRSALAGHQITPPSDSSPDAPWMEPLIGTGLKTSDVYTDGHVFLTVPLWSTLGTGDNLGGSYLFLEPYTSVGEQGEVATSVGLGFRHLFSNEHRSALDKKGMAGFMEEGWFVGANVFGDMLNTQHHNQFWQMGVGGEVGTRYFELRGNYYIPLTDEKQYASSTSQDVASSTTTQTEGGDLFAEGHSIVERAGSTVQTTTTSTTTTTTRLFEKGMRGWDAEGMLLLPWIDQYMDCRVNGGYFHFDNQPFGPSDGPTGPVHGWKVGAEIRPVPAIVLGAQWYEDERFTGSNWIVSVEFQIPLDRHWTDAFKMRRRHLIEHLAEPVHRQNDAIKVGNREDQKANVATTTTSKIIGQTAGGSVVATDFIFVNNGAAQANGIQAGTTGGDGTAEHPTNTITAGATLAGAQSNATGQLWTAYVQGGGAAYTGLATVTGSTRFLSSSQPLTFHGKTFGGTGPAAVLNGTIFADGTATPAIQTVSVQGFTLLNGTGGLSPIYMSDVPNVTILNNRIQQSASSGISLLATKTTSNATIQNNVIQQPSVDGISISTSGASTVNATIQGNVIQQAGNAGVDLVNSAGGTSALNATVTGNTISSPHADGITGTALSGTFSLALAKNTITSPTGNGIHLLLEASTGNATISGNTISHAGSNGISVEAELGATATATATGNKLTNSTLDGIAFTAGSISTATLTATATDNQIASAGAFGIQATAGSAATVTFDASGNAITAAGSTGIYIGSADGSILTATLTGNTITSPIGAGVIASAANSSLIQLTATNNAVTTPGTYGFYLLANCTTSTTGITADLEGNTITNAGSIGLLAQAQNGFFNLTAKNNTITSPVGDGMNISTSTNLTFVTINLTGNTITHAGSNGMILSDSTAIFSGITANIDGNTITDSTLDGINLQFHNLGIGVLSTVSGSINNVVTGSGGFSLEVLTPNTQTNIILNGANITPLNTTP